MNYPPTAKLMGWASEVIDSPNGNALLRFCFISELVPKPDSIFKPLNIYNFVFLIITNFKVFHQLIFLNLFFAIDFASIKFILSSVFMVSLKRVSLFLSFTCDKIYLLDKGMQYPPVPMPG